ncbi:hypothetical protein FZC84_15095 [Rossellomorea vietnamensis]|uniref:Uncharacterized protein n=1 Tax=Rossellomorea vietnamensis TaxID=218284 RepID=A0A5D4M9Y8_9BACI|nr:hypothetical protein [Rossellomorea vietnamensis]TYR98237.1 hypothetical protein FZC84_15095 [Rossellomorea vietnamensis]
MKEKESLINLASYKEKKQRQAEEHTEELYNQSLLYLERETNIREKVRAKFMFSKKFSLSLESAEPGSALDTLYRQWLLFDYKTAANKTVFHQFLQVNAPGMTETDRMLCALFLTAAWEPVEVLEIVCDENSLFVQNILHKHKEMVVSPFTHEGQLNSGDMAFIRKIPLVSKGMLLGPPFRVKDGEIFRGLLDHYENSSKDRVTAWRSFMKENAARFIAMSL